jgi:anti-sigma regulatory factor (Ser/Thr protein kinase)
LEKGGRFTVIFEDSGPGFDYKEALSLSPDQDPTRFSGRGIMILQNLCEKLEYSGPGNHVKAVYDWR